MTRAQNRLFISIFADVRVHLNCLFTPHIPSGHAQAQLFLHHSDGFYFGEKSSFFFCTDQKSRTCRKAMPVCNNIDYVNYFVSSKSRLFGAYRLQLLPVFNCGAIKVGEEMHILTIL